MKKILVVNGESYWQTLMPEFEVIQKPIQSTSWILREGQLYVADTKRVVQPDGILWRVGAIPPTPVQTTALHLIELAGIPCVNSAQTLKVGFDRLSMLAALQHSALPVIDFNVVTQSTLLKNIQMAFPLVVKVGNYHGGFGKVLVEDAEKWQDIKDLLFVTNDYITVEPYIRYQRDLRYLVIQDQVWAMSRKGQYWKANVGTIDYDIITPDTTLAQQVQALQQSLQADILAVDILEEADGTLHVVEYNDIPGLSGFSKDLPYQVVGVLKGKMAAASASM